MVEWRGTVDRAEPREKDIMTGPGAAGIGRCVENGRCCVMDKAKFPVDEELVIVEEVIGETFKGHIERFGWLVRYGMFGVRRASRAVCLVFPLSRVNNVDDVMQLFGL